MYTIHGMLYTTQIHQRLIIIFPYSQVPKTQMFTFLEVNSLNREKEALEQSVAQVSQLC